jgi:glycerophosphoryl diester phosphodiesterase
VIRVSARDMVLGFIVIAAIILFVQTESTAADAKKPLVSLRNNHAFPKQLSNSFVVIGHRGNSSEAPENTIAAINQAFALGGGMVEIDVHLSREGVPVIIHDETVDRTTNGKGLVSRLTVAQLKALDAGSWKNPRYANERIPTLAEALQAAKSKGKLLLDLKVDGMGRTVAEVVRKMRMANSSLAIGTWTASQASDFAHHLPGAQILRSNDDILIRPDFFKDAAARGITGFELGSNWSPEFVRAAHAHGMLVYAYTINDEPTMRKLIEMGIDGIETDVPRLLLRVVKDMSTR